MRSFCTLIALLALAVQPATAQRERPHIPTDTTGAFMDAGAAALMRRAREARLQTDRSVRSYTATVRSRFAAGMRMPLKDRTLFRQEAAVRVRWSRDTTTVVQLLATRAQSPGGVEPALGGFGITSFFDPSRDRMYFGFDMGRDRDADDESDYWIEHPLGEQAERFYRYQSGDTLMVRLQDGRVVRIAELRVIPRRNDPYTVRGLLSIDLASGALVQAAFRLARTVDLIRDVNAFDEEDRDALRMVPGFLKPFEFDISLMTVEYSLWEMRHWLPRATRFEGYGRTGAVRFPASFDISYQMQDVVTDGTAGAPAEADAVAATLAEWNADGAHTVSSNRVDRRRVALLVPRDTAALLDGEELPPPIGADAPGFTTDAELRDLFDRLASLPVPVNPGVPVTFGWGFGEPEMVRYNRVEAISVGARVAAPLPLFEMEAVARLGAADLHPNAALALRRSTMRRTIELRAYHELHTADAAGRALGFGNSMSALLFGRDEGEYYRATGVSIELGPPAADRAWYSLRTYAEGHDDVERNTHVALPRLWNDSVFRPNMKAAAATQYGAMLQLRPWWGTDPLRAQAGMDIMLQGEDGDFRHARGRVVLRAAAPLFHGVRIGAEAGAGTATGDVPAQRLFYLGGASTLRGYEPSVLAGTSMARGRVELARAYQAGNIALFSDWAWAGERDDIRSRDQLWALGVGASLMDGMLRVDLARGMKAPRGWRLELYVDALL